MYAAAAILMIYVGMSLTACDSIKGRRYLLQKEPAVSETDGKDAPVSRKEPKVQKESGPDQLYRRALEAYKSNDYETSVELFGTLLEKYPKYSLADNALYWTGECLYSRNEFEGAIAVFKAVEENYPDGNKVPDALLKTGYAYVAVDQFVDAIYYFKRIVMEYPAHPVSEKAQKMLDRFQVEGRSAPSR